MANPIPRVEVGDTRKFSTVYSAAPGLTPWLALYAGSGDGLLISSATATASSNGTAFHTFVTFSNTRQLYAWTWTASFSDGPVMFRGYVQAVKTISG